MTVISDLAPGEIVSTTRMDGVLWRARQEGGQMWLAAHANGFLQRDRDGFYTVDSTGEKRIRVRPAEIEALRSAIVALETDVPILAAHLAILAVANGHEATGPDSDLIAAVAAELGIDPSAAGPAAVDVAARIRSKQLGRLADLALADRTAAKDQRLDAVGVVTALAFLAETDLPAEPLLGALAAEGHNVTVTAAYKAGKSTLIENAAAALASAGMFLGRFDTGPARRVVLLNYELTRADQRSRIRALGLGQEALDRILVLNLRGVGLCLTTRAGRDWLIGQLSEHGADVLIVDTYGAASAPSVEHENDNASARRFLAALDEIKGRADCPSMLMTAHTGRKAHEEGAEHARGATVLDDWTDVRVILTKDRTTGARFLASEGRSSFDLPESVLHYDPASRGLWLPDADVGLSRSARRLDAAAHTVTEIVTAEPGVNTTELKAKLTERGVTNNDAKAAAIGKAVSNGAVHPHSDGRQVRYQPGPTHPDEVPCTG